MATPQRIFSIYHRLGQDAPLIRDFLVAKGDKVSGTVTLLCTRDAGKLLRKWGEEMHELCGVLDGSHDDPYAMEATQTWYWASLYAVVQGCDWAALAMDAQRMAAGTCGITSVPELKVQVDRLIALDPAQAKPQKLFLLWWAARRIYEAQTPADDQISIEMLMEVDLQDMKKRPYLEPVLAKVP
jgi:phosphoribosyl-ATP pyrophosphohydrolase